MAERADAKRVVDALVRVGGVEAEGEDVVLLEARQPGDGVVGEVVEYLALRASEREGGRG